MTPSHRALIVEDDNSWRQILGEILTDCDLDVDIAQNLDEAVIILKTQTHRLAVVDLSLSPNDHNNQDGMRVLDNVRRLDPGCQTILLTGFATVELAVNALTNYGAFTFLRKESFNRSQFKDIIHRILVSPPQTREVKHTQTAALKPSLSSQFSLPASMMNKALIVDDDAGWRSILEDLLGEAGFQVHACASFGEALGFLRKEKFSIAIIDLSLNGITDGQKDNANEQEFDGYQLLKITKENQIPAIVVSGFSDPGEIQRIYAKHSIAAYIEKQTFDRTTFKRIVEDAKITSKAAEELSALTNREREVLDLLAQGLANKEIADKLVITNNTVKRHLKAIFEKLGVHSRSAAVARVTGAKG